MRRGWPRVLADVDAYGCAVAGAVLSSEECAALAASYAADDLFRSRVVMARHGFGRGEYFRYPLPKLVADLREALFARLAPVANRWNKAIGTDLRFPGDHAAFLELCHQAGHPRRCCWNTARATTIACIRMSMAIWCSPGKRRFCSLRRRKILREANS
jgi:hypothetical protein